MNTCPLMAIAPPGWKPCMPGCDPKTCHDCTDQRAAVVEEGAPQQT